MLKAGRQEDRKEGRKEKGRREGGGGEGGEGRREGAPGRKRKEGRQDKNYYLMTMGP